MATTINRDIHSKKMAMEQRFVVQMTLTLSSNTRRHDSELSSSSHSSDVLTETKKQSSKGHRHGNEKSHHPAKTQPNKQHSGTGSSSNSGGIFHIGKTSKKDKSGSGSALGSLVSQTAMLVPAVAKAGTIAPKLSQDSRTESQERRGIWSSGDSVPETVSILSPITEDRGESRPEEASGEEDTTASVSQRVRCLENRLDNTEEKFTLTRPTSGFTTPRLRVVRPIGSPLKGAFTPHHKLQLEPTSPLATDEKALLDKLSHVADIAMVRDVAAERRKRFTQKRLDDRRRTQPVTLEEIREADSLESVSSFRAEVLRKASFSVFEQGGKDGLASNQGLPVQRGIKGQEVFPQHIKVERLKERRKVESIRYKTLPVTQQELGNIPESEALKIPERDSGSGSGVKTLRQKLEAMERDSLEDVRDGKITATATSSTISTSQATVTPTTVTAAFETAASCITTKAGESKEIQRTASNKTDQKTTAIRSGKSESHRRASTETDQKTTAIGSARTEAHRRTSIETDQKATTKVSGRTESQQDVLNQRAKAGVVTDHSKPVEKPKEVVSKQQGINQSGNTDTLKQAKSGIKTVAVTTATTSTVSLSSSGTMATTSSRKAAAAAKLAKLEVSDDELDKLVAINYKEISSRKKKSDGKSSLSSSTSSLSSSLSSSAKSQNQGQGKTTAEVRQSVDAQSIVSKPAMNSAITKQLSLDQGISAMNQRKQTKKEPLITANVPKKEEVDQKLSLDGNQGRTQVSMNTSQTLAKDSVSTPSQSSISKQPQQQQPMDVEASPGKAKSVSALNLLRVEDRRDSTTSNQESTTDTETAEDELSKLSVSEKLKLFKQLDKTAAQETESTSKHKRRFSDRKRRMQRANTMPITGEEISSATAQDTSAKKQEETKMSSSQDCSTKVQAPSTTSTQPATIPGRDQEPSGSKGCEASASKGQEVPFDKGKGVEPGQCVRRGSTSQSQQLQQQEEPRVANQEMVKQQQEKEQEEDSLSKLSIAEKVRLFSERKLEEAPQKRDAAVLRRKNRRIQSRFKTQPITSDEVEKARISPLAMSLVKPPDPEVLQTMSLRDQREFAAQHAEATLSDTPGSRPGSRSGSRPSSMVLEGVALVSGRRVSVDEGSGEDDRKIKGILKVSESHQPEVGRSILKSQSAVTASTEIDVRGILKTDHQPPPGGSTPAHSDSETERKPASILVRKSFDENETESGSSASSPPSGILKKDSLTPDDASLSHSILKRDSLQYDGDVGLMTTHGILKKESPSSQDLSRQEIRGILKKDSSFEAENMASKGGVLKKRDSGAGLMDTEAELRASKQRWDVNSNEKSNLEDRSITTERPVLKKMSSLELKLEQPITMQKEVHQEQSELGRPKRTPDSIVNELLMESKMRNRIKSEDDIMTPSNSSSSRVSSSLSRSRSARVAGRGGDSSTEEESSTSSEKISWIKNDAVARRRLRRLEEKGGNAARHSLTADLEKKINGRSGEELNGEHTGSLLNNHRPLEKSRSSPEKTPSAVMADPAVVKLRENKSSKPRPHSIAERLSMLQDSQATWRSKVEEKDVSKFTVEGRLNMAGISPLPDSPFLGRRQTSGRFPLKRGSPEASPTCKVANGDDQPFVRSSSLRLPKNNTPRTFDFDTSRTWRRQTPSPKSSPNLLAKLSSSSDITDDTESDSQTPTKVSVAAPDSEGFDEFFAQKSLVELETEKVKVTEDDFNHVFIESNDILETTKKIKPQRRKAGSRNPLKNLAQREDLQMEYEEVRTDIAERELRRIKREQIAGTAHIAQEALAGLASKENFSKVSLKKTDSFNATTPGSGHQPYRDLMLLQVKGRRHCQTRLVEPSAASINSGDCFLLVTSDRVYIWQGDFSNVIERSRAAEIAAHIYQKRDLGCKSTSEPTLITESKQHISAAGKKFWDLLGGYKEYQPPGPVEEDELYEMYMAESTRVYGIHEDGNLVLVDSGYLPQHDFLNSKMAFIFDFGSELYVWTGKHLPFAERKKAIKLAKEHWDEGYNYEETNINPVSPLRVESNGGLPTKADRRPEWALFGKVNENMETILFKEKFIDWPDMGRVIKVKGQDDDDKKNDPAAELKPYDISKMLPVDTRPVTLLIEGSNVGRGLRWTEVYEGLRREYEVLTLAVEVFHILEYDHIKLSPTSHGQLHDGDTYVIRWNLMISQTGMRHVRTQEARHSLTGRERWAYFFWQGRHSTITEKGASALMTVELDEERGPQIRVPQGKEPPCFLNLFNGHTIIHSGKREDETTATPGTWRLYLLRNELPGESYLQEVPVKTSSLRSRSSMLLLNIKTGIMHVWHGAKSASHTRQRAMETAKWLSRSCPLEVGLHKDAQIIVTEVSEGSEKSDFWVAMDTRTRIYDCLIKDASPYHHSPRLFYMQSVCGEFVAREILNPSRNHDNFSSPFGFDQTDLYNASQPGLFLVDNHFEVYLWQGWWPEETETTENVRTGSAEARLNVDRRLAIQTTINYCTEKNKTSPPKAWLVYAGLEPARFTNLFPVWSVNEEAKRSNIKDGRREDERTALDKLLHKLTCTQYTLAELQERPLPEGVDPLKLESYLVEKEFEEILHMSRDEFYAMPSWKQNNIKKNVGLF